MFSKALITQAKHLLKACEKRGVMIATAESCTGGLVAALFTDIPGSSAVFERGFVTYSNAAKAAQLGVPVALIKHHGAVSAEVAKAMAKGALKYSKAQIAVAITGIAGPGGGTKAKPVGLVYIAIAHPKGVIVDEFLFIGSRANIRLSAVKKALALIINNL